MHIINRKLDFVRRGNIKRLTDKDIDNLYNSYQYFKYQYYFCKINGEIFHIKQKKLRNYVNELLGQIISEYFGAETIKSSIVKDQYNKLYLITKNFIEEGHQYATFSRWFDIFPYFKYEVINEEVDLLSLNNLDYIRKNGGENIISTNKKDLLKFKYDLKLMIVSDFIRNQTDRALRNFMFEYKDDNVKLMPLYDFESSFLDSVNINNFFQFNLNNNKTVEYVKNDEDFQELLYKAFDIDMGKVFEQLFDEYPILLLEDEINAYKDVVKNKKKDIKEYKLIR